MTVRYRVLLTLLFGSVFLAGLVSFAPASLMGYALERASGGTLTLAQTKGSLWNGSGIALLRLKTRYQMLGSYRWGLKLFNASLQVQTGEAAPMTMRYVPFSGRVNIDNLHITLPVTIIEIASPQLGPYQLQGSLEASCDHLTLDAGGMNGQITMNWLRAASALSSIRPLGDYRILVQGHGGSLDMQLSTLSGKLLLSGNGSYDNAAGMRFSGTAQAAPGTAETELNEMLHHIGPEISPGVFSLALMPQAAVR